MANKVIKTEYDYDMGVTKDKQSGNGIITSGEGSLSAFTLVAFDSSTGKWVVYADETHTGNKLAITKFACDATSADVSVQLLLEGEIKAESVVAGDAVVTDATVIDRCMKSGIYFA